MGRSSRSTANPLTCCIEPNFDVSLLVPNRWRQALVSEQEYIPDSGEKFRTFIENIRWPNNAVIHSYPRLDSILEEAAPDILLAIEEPYSLITARLLRWCIRRTIPFVFHSYQDLYKRYPPPFCWTQRYVLNRSDAALVANKTVEEVLRKKGFLKPVVLYPYGLDPEQFSPPEEMSSGLLKIGYVGRLVPEKGVDLLIQSAKELPSDIRIVIVGDGSERSSLESLAKENGIANIEWRGSATPAALPDIYRELDILVVTFPHGV